MTPEQLLYNRIRQNLGNSCDIQRIETVTARGVPDINICHNVWGEFWLEAKAGKHLRPLMRPEQWAWMKRRAFFGGRCAVVTWFEGFFYVFPIKNDSKAKPAGKLLTFFPDYYYARNPSLAFCLWDAFLSPADEPPPDAI
jgi:hypothetical protein